MRFAIINTRVANIASVKAALQRLGVEIQLVETPAEMDQPEAVVLPGVGAFDAGFAKLLEFGWDKFLVQRFEKNQPTLAICLGMQMLCDCSQESAGARGLGFLPGKVVQFPDSVTVPQFGWNEVDGSGNFFKNGYAYFANSYCLELNGLLDASGWELQRSNHGMPFVAAAKKGNWLACQYHPELSSKYGASLLEDWIREFAKNRSKVNT